MVALLPKGVYEIANIFLIVAFAMLPLFLQDRVQSIVLIALITAIGSVLQVGAVVVRKRGRLHDKASS